MTNAILVLLWLVTSVVQVPVAAPAQLPTSSAPSPTTTGPVPLGFQLGPGDVVEVNAWTGNESLRDNLTIAADGTVLVPFYVNKLLKAQGLTSIQLRELITEEMRSSFRNPVVQVVQTRLESRKVLLVGEASRPGAYPITGNTKILDIIIGSGGFTAAANLAEVAISRTRTNEQLTINILDALLGINSGNNISLEPEDIVFIPSLGTVSNKYFFISEGKASQLLQSAEKINLLEGLTRAGMIGAGQNLRELMVIRVSPKDGNTEVNTVKFDDIYRKQDLSVNVPLENGDIVYIPKSGLARFSDVVTAINPLLGFIRDTIVFTSLIRKPNL